LEVPLECSSCIAKPNAVCPKGDGICLLLMSPLT